MKNVWQALCVFFRRDEQFVSLQDSALSPVLNSAARGEIFYAELMENEWARKPREYPWPPGWTS